MRSLQCSCLTTCQHWVIALVNWKFKQCKLSGELPDDSGPTGARLTRPCRHARPSVMGLWSTCSQPAVGASLTSGLSRLMASKDVSSSEVPSNKAKICDQ